MGRPKTRTPEKIKEQQRKSSNTYREKNRNNPEYWERTRDGDRRRYADNPEGKKERARVYRAEHPDRRMLTDAKRRAKKLGLEFNIELSDIVIPDVCPVLGIPLFRAASTPDVKLNGSDRPNSPSLDRIDNTKGYIKGNVWVISWRANHIKTDATIEELKRLVTALELQRK